MILLSTITGDNLRTAQAVAAAWETNWSTFFTSGIYQAVNKSMLGLGLIFLVVTVVITMLDYAKTQSMVSLSKLIAPSIVVCFFNQWRRCRKN
ncbi:MAG: hypothetical protein HC784_14115 [Hydrococcus sp. CSU_1_8]|nr:hypothetical protein [Hydrococcus sp. CSU_1_8]